MSQIDNNQGCGCFLLTFIAVPFIAAFGFFLPILFGLIYLIRYRNKGKYSPVMVIAAVVAVTVIEILIFALVGNLLPKLPNGSEGGFISYCLLLLIGTINIIVGTGVLRESDFKVLVRYSLIRFFGIPILVLTLFIMFFGLTTGSGIAGLLLTLYSGFMIFGSLVSLVRGTDTAGVIRGTELTDADNLQRLLDKKQQAKGITPKQVQLSIGGVRLPSYLENLGFFFVGSPGSGKSQAIARIMSELKQRQDFRVIVFDRNGEMLEKFFDPSTDLLFNPVDKRSVSWSHKSERARPETIAAALIRENQSKEDAFFVDAARSLLSDLYERCDNNAEVWYVLSHLSLEDLTDFVKGGVSQRYFVGENTGGSVLSTLVNQARFYRELIDGPNSISFSDWARSGDTRSLYLPLFEEDAELFKPFYSAAFELVIKGLLSNEDRVIKTAVVIDELGALNHLKSLSRLLSESRKFGGCAILGTQTEAQIRKTYGEEDTRILLQGTATKLILNCRDATTAEMMAQMIGKQERVDITSSKSDKFLGDTTQSENIRETYAVMPSELQSLPPLQGFLTIADGTPPAMVQVTPRSYPNDAPRLQRRVDL